MTGTPEQWETLSRTVPGFPLGSDHFIHRKWITNAIHCGSKLAVQWMLERGVSLNFKEDEGFTPLHCALERNGSDRYEILEMLLRAGAPINMKGLNDWTPAHMAAALDDVEALKMLVRYGADLSIRSDIDDYATPLEEARNLKQMRATEYLEGLG